MNAKRDVLVGLTAILGLGGFAVLLLAFGEFADLRTERYDVTFVMPDAQGLSPGAPVLFNGIRVGRVGATMPADDPREGVSVTLRIDEGVRLPRESVVSVRQDFIGDVSLAIRLTDDPPATLTYLEAGDSLAVDPQGLFDSIAGRLVDELDARLMPFEAAASSFTELSETYTALGRSLGGLVEPASTDEVDAGTARVSIPSLIERVDQAASAVVALTDDEGLPAEASATLEEVRTLAAELRHRSAALQANADTITAEVELTAESARGAIARVTAALDSIALAADDVRVITARINAGEGTVGQLTTNPQLYRSLDEAARELRVTLLEAQLLIQKWKAEGLPIQL